MDGGVLAGLGRRFRHHESGSGPAAKSKEIAGGHVSKFIALERKGSRERRETGRRVGFERMCLELVENTVRPFGVGPK